jgi:hypothetical protein
VFDHDHVDLLEREQERQRQHRHPSPGEQVAQRVGVGVRQVRGERRGEHQPDRHERERRAKERTRHVEPGAHEQQRESQPRGRLGDDAPGDQPVALEALERPALDR